MPIGSHCLTYSPVAFTQEKVVTWTSDTSVELDRTFDAVNTHFVSQQIPVIVGEWGVEDGSKAVDSERAKYVAAFKAKAKALGIGCIYWYDLIDRNTYAWKYPLTGAAVAGN